MGFGKGAANGGHTDAARHFILSSRLVFRPSTPENLDPNAPPKRIAEEVRQELKAGWVNLIGVPELAPLGERTPPRELFSDRPQRHRARRQDHPHPTLTVTGPRRLPRARTNARWTNSLAIPILEDGHTVGVIYATRNSIEPFTDKDLHWLTAYASTAGPIFARHRKALKDRIKYGASQPMPPGHPARPLPIRGT